jgi:hypothetical protein
MTVRRPIRAKPRSKFGAESCIYENRRYHSRKEAAYARDLDLRRHDADERRRVVAVEPQFKVSLDVNGKHVTNYFVDFRVTFGDGSVQWIEVKGFETPEWIIKRRLFEAIYPNRKLVVVR